MVILPPSGARPLQLLLVEDNPADAMLLREALRDAGETRFELDHVARLSDGLKRIAAALYDVVLLDLRLPDSQGLETLSRMLDHARGVPIVVMTGLADERLAMNALRQGAQDYLVKGEVAGDTLARSIRYAIGRHTADEALRATSDTLSALIDATPLAIVVLDREHRVRRWNRAAEELFGWKEDEVLGGRPPQVPEEQREAFESMVQSELQGQRHAGLELLRRRKDGSSVDVSLWTAPLRDAQQNVVGTVRIFADVGERKRLEERLRQSQKMEAIGRLAGGIAHDFNNLLTVILGYAELAQTSLGRDDPLQRELAEIRKAAVRAAALTNQLLAFSRRQVLRPKLLDLNAVIVGFDAMLRPLLGEQVEIVLELERGLGDVRADPGQLEQVLMNLALNARDAMPAGGRLTFATRAVEIGAEEPSDLRRGPYVLLSVSDTGSGMSPDTLAHAFEPFFTTKEEGKGTGLGLATVYGIVKQSGGEIRAASEVGRGTTFEIYLPRADATIDSARGMRALARGERGERGTGTVLVVEDDETLRGFVRAALESHGYRVLEAASGAQASQLCTNHDGPIELMVADVELPRVREEGAPLLLAAPRQGMRVLYVSGYRGGTSMRLPPGASFLNKPLTSEDLLAQVRRMLDA